MTYPPVIQFETRAFEAEARARLAGEQRAARALGRPADRRGGPLMNCIKPRTTWAQRVRLRATGTTKI